MRLRLRLLLTLLIASFRSRLAATATSTIGLRVLPTDVDLLHVTNDRYLAYMDLGRNDLAVRIGLFRAVRRLGAFPVVRTLDIRYRRPARLLARLELRTRILCWSSTSAWFEQEFFVAGRSIALAHCKAEMRSRIGVIGTRDLLLLAGHPDHPSPAPSPIVVLLEELERRKQAAQGER